RRTHAGVVAGSGGEGVGGEQIDLRPAADLEPVVRRRLPFRTRRAWLRGRSAGRTDLNLARDRGLALAELRPALQQRRTDPGDIQPRLGEQLLAAGVVLERVGQA